MSKGRKIGNGTMIDDEIGGGGWPDGRTDGRRKDARGEGQTNISRVVLTIASLKKVVCFTVCFTVCTYIQRTWVFFRDEMILLVTAKVENEKKKFFYKYNGHNSFLSLFIFSLFLRKFGDFSNTGQKSFPIEKLGRETIINIDLTPVPRTICWRGGEGEP